MIQKHVHKLKRHKYKSGSAVYFCTLPDCHFKIDTALALGKRSICNICLNEFIMDDGTLKLALPHCRNCGKQRVKTEDGKTIYVSKKSNPVLESMAISNTNDLRARLNGIVITTTPIEDDI